ncbi:hypothetical protein jhhlp_008398 [Lomentospora prolificans]|uniref:LCCL domain-containing protein n=1 Tax=Lomentospora prolificans TaxID=41688 RepID=A0A2N3MXY5_9PEZI|nr:hypothetical protein jhhlp_008398 [Lomentospora prolificans]
MESHSARWRRPAVDEEGFRLLRSPGAHEYDEERTPAKVPILTERQRFCLPRWFSGPREPRRYVVRPVFPFLQQWPVQLLDRLSSTVRGGLIAVFFLIWITAFSYPLASSHQPFKDGDEEYVRNLNCDDSLWSLYGCGIDGELCRPFMESHFSFRCPADCADTVSTYRHPVGGQDVIGQPLVIGSNPFRADSYICSAAIHALITSDEKGGCGRVTRVGKHDTYAGFESNGVLSVEFDSYFPFSFTVSPDPEVACEQHLDPRGWLLGVSVIFLGVFSLFVTSPAWQFYVAFTAVFAHVALVSDPAPVSFRSTAVLPERMSSFLQRLLPSLFVAVVLYKMYVRRTLVDLTAQVEKTILWTGGLWFGAMANYTLDWFPADNISAYELTKVSTATFIVAAVVAAVGFLVAWHLYCLWTEGRFEKYFLFYSTTIVVLVLVAWVPGAGLELHLHHYILSLLLIPVTATQTRLSLLSQGALLGLFIHDVAHSGFSPILELATSLTVAYPTLRTPTIIFSPQGSNITLSFEPPPSEATYDGVSVMVNDVEKWRMIYAEIGKTGSSYTLNWASDIKYDEWLRYGYIRDGRVVGYGPAGTWFSNGTFVGEVGVVEPQEIKAVSDEDVEDAVEN